MSTTARRWFPFSFAASLAAALSLAFVPAPLLAAPGRRGKRGKKKAAATAPAEPATDGKTIAMFRFAGADAGADLRSLLVMQFQDGGFSVKSVALELPEASAKVKCPSDDPEGADCLQKVGEWLNSNPKTAADYLVWGSVTPGPPQEGKVTVFDVKGNKVVKAFDATMAPGDLIVPLTLRKAVVTSVNENIEPRKPATEEELAAVAALDEPDKTPEELAAEQREIEEAEAAAAKALQDKSIDTSTITADLKEDFEDFCRTGKRKKRESREAPRDLRPKCQRGPFWGYWQPRAWVALTLTVGFGASAGLLYGLSAAKRGKYKDAVKAVDDYNAMAGGDPTKDPHYVMAGGQSYDELATHVSTTGTDMRKLAVAGDFLLGTTALIAGVLGVIIYQDRADAKRFIKEEKALRAISDVRVSPMLGKTKGLGLSLRF